MVTIALSLASGSETTLQILNECSHWLAFTLFGGPDINELDRTWLITAGVMWTLVIEWSFYFLLPLFSIAMRKFPPLLVIAIPLALVAMILPNAYESTRFMGFLGAPLALYLVDKSWVRQFASTHAASALTLVFIVLSLRSTAYGLMQIAFLSIAFSLIACGCSIFGVLTTRWALFMGQAGYGIYLLHGLLLFIAFRLIMRTEHLPPLEHWGIVVCMTPILLTSSYLAFRFIEKPCIQTGKTVGNWLENRRRLSRIKAVV